MCAKILKTVDINQVWYKKDVSLSAKSRGKMIMNKIIGLAVLLFCLSGCVRDNDAIYYPVGNVDVERGGPALEAGKGDSQCQSCDLRFLLREAVTSSSQLHHLLAGYCCFVKVHLAKQKITGLTADSRAAQPLVYP